LFFRSFLDNFLLDLTVHSPHGGLFGSLNWAAMLILGTALADMFHDEGRGRKVFPWDSLGILTAGIGLSFLLPVSEHRVTASYVLIGLGISGLVFSLVDLLARYLWLDIHALVACGKNAFALYIIHYALIGILFLPGIPTLFTEAPFWLVVTEISVMVTGIITITYWLERKKLSLAF